MKPLWAIAKLTWKAAFRYRLFWALAALLLVAVVALPLLLRDDGTARGFIQILLTYNLSIITALLGLATLWLACGILARDIEDCQLQMIAVKPVSSWQIWLGKWLGIMMLNALLLALAGGSVFLILKGRAKNLPPDQQAVLRNEIFTARASVREPPPDLNDMVNRVFRERLAQTPVPVEEQAMLRQSLYEQARAGVEVVPPDFKRRWELNFGLRRHLVTDEPMYMRFKFHAAQTNLTGTYTGRFLIGPPGTERVQSRMVEGLAPDAFHEFQIPNNAFDEQGKLTIEFINWNDSALLFPIEDGFEVLYREGGFGLNYVRGLLILLSWLGFLAALGLAAGSLLSFPVAAFCSLSLLVVALSSGTMASVVEEGTVTGLDHETGQGGIAWLDAIMLPLFKAILAVVGLLEGYSPIDALSTGRSITWAGLGVAWGQIVLLLGGLLAVLGILTLSRRELALPHARS